MGGGVCFAYACVPMGREGSELVNKLRLHVDESFTESRSEFLKKGFYKSRWEREEE